MTGGPRKPIRVRAAVGVTATVAIVFAVGLLLLGQNFSDPPQATQRRAAASMSMQGMQTSIITDGRLRARVSADALEVTRPRVLGPFRIGFLKSVEARNVTVETFEEPDTESAGTSPVGIVSEAVAALLPQHAKGIAHVDVSPLRVIQHGKQGAQVILQAARCRTSFFSAGLVCSNGQLSAGDGRIDFKEARFDGKEWEVTQKR